MTSDPDQIREQIEETRGSLSHDVNTLADTVNPVQVTRRKAARARTVMLAARDKVMGAASQSVSGGSASVGDALSGSAGKLRSQAAGNPLAVGLIALGVGWLAGSLLPASTPEQQAAAKVKEDAGPVIADTAREVTGNLQEPAQQAVESVKSAAADAGAAVREQSISSAQAVTAQAQDAKDTVQDSRS
jgi:Protein of unknown function (DUF3618)